MADEQIATNEDDRVQAFMMAAAAAMRNGRDEVLRTLGLIEAWMKIHAPDRTLPTQLLALRRYLRMREKRKDLQAIWSWTDAEVMSHMHQEPTRSLYAEAAKVQQRFAAQNLGYTLTVTPVRSLERQVRLWGKSASVAAAGSQLLKKMRDELSNDDYAPRPDQEGVLQFSFALARSHVSPEPTNAAPGTSDHGRGVAVDFQVQKNGRTVADIKTSTIQSVWKLQGWEQKLIDACAGTRLRGPLQHPYESWHWWLEVVR